MRLFKREIKVVVEKKNNQLKITAVLNDTTHDMQLGLLIDIDTLEIKDVSAQMERVPYVICHKALDGIKNLVGLRIEAGINKKVKALIGGIKGCVHIVELLHESFKAAYQANIRIIVNDMTGDARTAKLEVLLKGSCLRYTEEHALMDLHLP